MKNLAGFLDVEDFSPLIVPALRTGAVRHFPFVAVGTLREAVALQSVMGAPGGGALLRMSTFWIRHGFDSFFGGVFGLPLKVSSTLPSFDNPEERGARPRDDV
jgi:hypothetical protein